MSRYLSEPEAWRRAALEIDRNSSVGLFGACQTKTFRKIAGVAMERLRSYDGPAGGDYGARDDYANMDAADRILAALWLALEAEDERKSLRLAGGTET